MLLAYLRGFYPTSNLKKGFLKKQLDYLKMYLNYN